MDILDCDTFVQVMYAQGNDMVNTLVFCAFLIAGVLCGLRIIKWK